MTWTPWQLFHKYRALAAQRRQANDFDDAADCEEIAQMHRRVALKAQEGGR